jgi:flagellar biosynthesis protein FliQ
MSADGAVILMATLLRVVAFVAGPILLASLLAGVAIGIVQTATQINEASISYVVKAAAVVLVVVVLGPTLAAYTVTYARTSFESIERVTHPER